MVDKKIVAELFVDVQIIVNAEVMTKPLAEADFEAETRVVPRFATLHLRHF